MMGTLGNILMFWSAAALVLFPFCYHFATKGAWRRSMMGVHLMSFMGVLGAVICLAVANYLAGGATSSALPEWVRPLAWGAIGGVAWWRLILLFVVQYQDGDD